MAVLREDGLWSKDLARWELGRRKATKRENLGERDGLWRTDACAVRLSGKFTYNSVGRLLSWGMYSVCREV